MKAHNTLKFGHIPGHPVGSVYRSREELRLAGLHSANQAGISGNPREGADAIVVSGGYIDDEDNGDVILYTGEGGRDANTGRQVRDQEITSRGNAALVRSQLEGLPVRVIRGRPKGKGHGSPHAPSYGYRYDGLYRVEDHWATIGKDGYRIWRFRLVKLEDDDIAEPPEVAPIPEAHRVGPAPVTVSPIQRIVRNSTVAQLIKDWYGHECQICGQAIQVRKNEYYSEAAHIRPLGRPHQGPDVLENLLCLCPNDHVRFDNGALYLSDQLQVINTLTGEVMGPLRVHKNHKIDLNHVAYHRTHVAAVTQPR